MAEEQRKFLERLMGKDALISSASRRKDIDIKSHKVCKSFLVGVCPHDLFNGTKQNLGKCLFLHLEKHKLEYEHRTKTLGESFPSFELDHYKTLHKYIYDLEKKIEVAQKRLEHKPEEKEKIASLTKKLEILDTKIGLKTQEIDSLLMHDEFLKLLYESIELNELYKKRNSMFELVRNMAENLCQTSQQKLQVCEGCGAYLSRLDSDRRLADHLIGKLHLGYVQMKQAYDELKQKIKYNNF